MVQQKNSTPRWMQETIKDIRDRKVDDISEMEEISCFSEENQDSLKLFEIAFINRDVQLNGTINKANGVLKSLYLELGDFEVLCRASQVEEMLLEMKEFCPTVVSRVRASL